MMNNKYKYAIGFYVYFFISLSLFGVNRKPFIYGETGFPTTLDPVTTNELLTVRLTELIFNRLVKFDDKGDIVSDLAESWTFMPENMGVTFKLRKVVKFQQTKFSPKVKTKSKQPQYFTSEDVVFTFRLLVHPKTNIPNRIRFEFIKNVIAVDKHTVRFIFKRPVKNALGKLSFEILPAHMFPDRSYLLRKDPFTRRPIGTGPYQISKVTSEGEVILKRNPDYFGKKPYFPKITMKPYADRNILTQALLFEAIDLITLVDSRNVPEVDGDKRFRLIPYNALSYSFFAFNFRNQLLKKKNVRKAITMAINRQEMLNSFFHGRGKLITGPFAPGSWAYNLNVKAVGYSPNKSRALLKSLGYRKKNEQDILVKKGQPLKFNLKVPISSESESVKRIILAFQNYLHKVGIQVDISFVEWHVWKQEVFRDHDFDIVFASWAFDDSNDISSLFHSGEVGVWKNNFIKYRNRTVDGLIIESKTTVDFEKKRTINKMLHEVIAKDYPYVFLWTLTNYAAVNNNIRNVQIHPYRFFTFINQWYDVK